MRDQRVLMYSIGLVLGTRFWLHRFSQSFRDEARVLGSADRAERVSFDAEQRDLEHRRSGSTMRRTIDMADLFGNVADLFSDLGELTVLLFVPALVLFAIGILMLLGLAPMFVADGAAALLVVASAGAGWLLTQLEPGAVSIGDLFRR